ncbi:MAG: FHA domain-containing protein [Coriobacteriales bacterium]|jgi:hypothetical protein
MTQIQPNVPFDNDKTQAFNLSNPDATIPNINVGSSHGMATLTIVRGPLAGERFDLDIPEVTIGRDPSCEVFLNDRTVSRHHAHLTLRDGGAMIEDLGSLNGTWVDGAIVSSCALHDGSSIQIGTFKMILNIAQ